MTSSILPLIASSVVHHPVVLFLVMALGACIGSFLNVVIYRLPRDLSVSEPKRSFCPHCKTQIPWYRNLPIVTWIAQRGKCASCGAPIAARYLVVEAITMLLFLALWITFAPMGWGAVLGFWVLGSLLLAASFIDFEHYIIPDSINLGGAIAGFLLAGLVPLADSLFPSAAILNPEALRPLHLPSPVWSQGIGHSLLGALAGYGLVWSVVQLGKLAFGRKIHEFKDALPWKIHEPAPDAEPQFEVGEDVYPWSELFARPTDQLIIEGAWVRIDGEKRTGEGIIFHFDRALHNGETIALSSIQKVEGETLRIIQPREAMGFGDVKFVAMIGAFLGWQATVFTLIGGALLGAIIGMLQKAGGGAKWGQPIPFGPYLALAALIFLFAGPAIITWYLNLAGLS